MSKNSIGRGRDCMAEIRKYSTGVGRKNGLFRSTFSSVTHSILAKCRYINKYCIGVGREKNFSIGVGRKDSPLKISFV